MIEDHIFSKETIRKIKSVDDAKILQPIQVGATDCENELVFFIKPELLDVEEDGKILNSLELIKEKFSEFNVEIHGAAIIPGSTLDQFEIMNRHYGYINQLSRMASSMVDADTRARIFEILNLPDQDEHLILGGHEFIKTFNTDVDTLSKIWFAQEANKLRSGFYFIEDRFEEKPIILVNGFHPSQLLHFTREDHRILLLLLHTDTDWVDLKFELVGDTFPERAKPESIRGMLFANPDLYGQDEVGINTNGVHLSAGPFEAAFEVVNFFGDLLDLNPRETPPLAISRAIKTGLEKEVALALLGNPPLDNSDLFTETENINTSDAVQFAKVQTFDQN